MSISLVGIDIESGGLDGYIEIDGQRTDLAGMATEDIVNLGVALVPEGRRLFPMLTVEENLLLGAYRADARKDIDRNMEFCL